jgi:hypothetical protein
LSPKTHRRKRGSGEKLKEAVAQIEKQNYGKAYDNPVFLAIVINDKKRIISAWESWERED